MTITERISKAQHIGVTPGNQDEHQYDNENEVFTAEWISPDQGYLVGEGGKVNHHTYRYENGTYRYEKPE